MRLKDKVQRESTRTHFGACDLVARQREGAGRGGFTPFLLLPRIGPVHQERARSMGLLEGPSGEALTEDADLRHGSVQAEEHPQRLRGVHAQLHARRGAVVAEVQLAVGVDHQAQDVAAVQGPGHAAHGPELLAVRQGLGAEGQVRWPQRAGVARGDTEGERPGPRAARARDLDEDGLGHAHGPAGEDERALVAPVLQARHGLLVQDSHVRPGAQRVEAQVAVELRGQRAAVLRVERVLRDGAAGGRRGLVALGARHVEVAQAHGEARLVGVAPQGRPPQGGEGARPQAVREHQLAVCGRGGGETGRLSRGPSSPLLPHPVTCALPAASLSSLRREIPTAL